MDLDAAWKIVGPTLTSGGGFWAAWKLTPSVFPHPATSLRRDINRNLDLLDRIPDDTRAHALLLEDIDKSVARLLVTAKVARRDPSGVVLGLIFLAIAALLGWWALQLANLWAIPVWLLCAFCTIFGLFGFFEGLKAVPRDDKGRSIGKVDNDLLSDLLDAAHERQNGAA